MVLTSVSPLLSVSTSLDWRCKFLSPNSYIQWSHRLHMAVCFIRIELPLWSNPSGHVPGHDWVPDVLPSDCPVHSIQLWIAAVLQSQEVPPRLEGSVREIRQEYSLMINLSLIKLNQLALSRFTLLRAWRHRCRLFGNSCTGSFWRTILRARSGRPSREQSWRTMEDFLRCWEEFHLFVPRLLWSLRSRIVSPECFGLGNWTPDSWRIEQLELSIEYRDQLWLCRVESYGSKQGTWHLQTHRSTRRTCSVQ